MALQTSGPMVYGWVRPLNLLFLWKTPKRPELLVIYIVGIGTPRAVDTREAGARGTGLRRRGN